MNKNQSQTSLDEYWMQKALELAQIAYAKDEVPVGAIIVKDNKIIAEGYNQPITTKSAAAHAEMIAIENACKNQNNYRLPGLSLYVTLEPCLMCAGAMIHARIKRLVFGAFEPKTGVVGSVCNIFEEYKWNHKIDYTSGILNNECSKILKDYFLMKRK